MDFHFAARQVDGHAAVQAIVVEKVLLDDLALIAQGNEKLFTAVVSIMLHDMPEDRPAPDLDHRFGLDLGFFGQAGAQPPGQDDDFHSARPMTRAAPAAPSAAIDSVVHWSRGRTTPGIWPA